MAHTDDELAAEHARLKNEVLRLQVEKLEYEIADWVRDETKHEVSEDAHRIYDFTGEVDERSVKWAIQAMGNMARESDERITLRLNSEGGSVTDGLALIDFLLAVRRSGTPIDTVGMGMVASMGAVILQAGDRRYVSPNCFMLIHEVSSVSVGKVSALKDAAAFSEVLWTRLLDVLAERSTMTARQIRTRASRRDWWIGAEDAVKLGFADEVLS